jgi:hypothetical protein
VIRVLFFFFLFCRENQNANANSEYCLFVFSLFFYLFLNCTIAVRIVLIALGDPMWQEEKKGGNRFPAPHYFFFLPKRGRGEKKT